MHERLSTFLSSLYVNKKQATRCKPKCERERKKGTKGLSTRPALYYRLSHIHILFDLTMTAISCKWIALPYMFLLYIKVLLTINFISFIYLRRVHAFVFIKMFSHNPPKAIIPFSFPLYSLCL